MIFKDEKGPTYNDEHKYCGVFKWLHVEFIYTMYKVARCQNVGIG